MGDSYDEYPALQSYVENEYCESFHNTSGFYEAHLLIKKIITIKILH